MVDTLRDFFGNTHPTWPCQKMAKRELPGVAGASCKTQANSTDTVRERIITIALMLMAGCLGAATSLAAPIPAPPGLVGWWPGDGNANDMAGTNNGVLMAGALDTDPGIDGRCFTFDGTNAFVQIPN